MIERLILVRADLFGDRQPPFLGIVEFRIDVENHAPERKYPVTDDLPDLKFGGPRFNHISSNRPSLWPMLEANGRINLCCGWSIPLPIGAINDEKNTPPMVAVLNLALPYFGLIFIG